MDRLDDWSFKTKKMTWRRIFTSTTTQLGNALLLENCELKERSDKLHEQYADKLEALEQGRHELRQKLEGCQSQWESQVGELERDVRELRGQVERLTRTLSEAERDKSQPSWSTASTHRDSEISSTL
ncbi:BICD family-like cargo adapter 1 [Dissostichus eleginoides]|uniref:BICD family-like cargo adapter 1 n=1 Tax=Dissostichus eleginoides TaxID=100907 RepID=A0AAD9CFA3_DISEL|nr:BICD family-like cargo adapter 1 [Dissostichus eleginoides]